MVLLCMSLIIHIVKFSPINLVILLYKNDKQNVMFKSKFGKKKYLSSSAVAKFLHYKQNLRKHDNIVKRA